MSQHVRPEGRFFARVEQIPDGCWLWTGPMNVQRYASFMVNGRTVMAHRWAYEHWVGPIPDGKQIDHVCGVTRCVNPIHLRPLEPYENVRAYWRSQRGVCRNGHELTAENVVWREQGKRRRCRICERERARRWKAKLRLG